MRRWISWLVVASAVMWSGPHLVVAAEIHKAIASGDEARVVALLKANPKLAGLREGIVDPPIVTAAKAGDPKILELLIGAGANVNDGDLRGHQPLYWAVALKKQEAVKVLLDRGADVNAGPDPALMSAVSGGQNDLVILLREKGARTDIASKEGRTLLHAAAEAGNLELVKELIEAGANVHAANRHGITPLFGAVGGGHLEVAKYLLEKGAKADVLSHDALIDGTPLSVAANGDGEWVDPMIDLLLAHRADPNLGSNTDAYIPLIWVSGRGEIARMKRLIEAGANTNGKGTSERWTPLIAAARQGRTEAVKFLLDKGADVLAEDYKGRTALHHAMENAKRRPAAGDTVDVLNAHLAKRGINAEAATKPAVDKEWAEITRLVAAKLPPVKREPAAIPVDRATQESFVALALRMLSQFETVDTSLRQHVLVRSKADQEAVLATEATLAATVALADQVRATFPEQAKIEKDKGWDAPAVASKLRAAYQDAELRIEGDRATLTPQNPAPIEAIGGEKPKAIYFARSGQAWKIDIRRMWNTESINIEEFRALSLNVMRAHMQTIRDLRAGRVRSSGEVSRQVQINLFAAGLENPVPTSQPATRPRVLRPPSK